MKEIDYETGYLTGYAREDWSQLPATALLEQLVAEVARVPGGSEQARLSWVVGVLEGIADRDRDGGEG